jgi:hypothetical protein
MHSADTTTHKTILNYFPERIQNALEGYAAEIELPPEALVQLGIGYFLETADIAVAIDDEDSSSMSSDQDMLSCLPASLREGIEKYATEYEFPPEFVVEMAVTFLLDPDASSFDDCQVSVQKEQVGLLQNYREAHEAEAA